ncbi:MAG TPA: 50S ribosomal protein L10 [Candidatus Nanoarchaeia archaeon]|nr:50S ribosomal protein L10 [Candidatus Nanoarchaeia archaeon]
MAKKAHVSEAKKKQLSELDSLLQQNQVIGLADLTNLPSAQLQKIKYKLRGKMQIRVFNKNVTKLALNSHKDKTQGISELIPLLDEGLPAVLLTNEGSFKIAKLVNKSKSKAPAKAGQIAPIDIIIEAGPTQFLPGPMIGEFGQMGIKTMVEGGKISIKEDTKLVKKGNVINAKQADIMSKLGIMPMEIGLKIIGLLEKGVIYNGDLLSIDEKVYLDQLKTAFRESLAVALFIAYPSKETINPLLKKAIYEEKALEKKLNLQFDSAKVERIEEANNDNKKEEVKNVGGIPQYNDEMAKKAQDILEKLKDEDIKHHK